MILESQTAHSGTSAYAASEALLKLTDSFTAFPSMSLFGPALGLLAGDIAFLILADEPVGCDVKTSVVCGEFPFQAGTVAEVVKIVPSGNVAIFPVERTTHESVRFGEDSHLQAAAFPVAEVSKFEFFF